METIWVILSIIFISYLFTHLMWKLKVPEVVSLLILGLFFGYPTINTLIIGESYHIIEYLGILGLFALLYLAGLESSWYELKYEEKDAMYIALFCLIIPFFLGLTIMYLFLEFSFLESFIVALCISITAESAKARVLFDMGVLKTRVASALLGAGIIDDIIGIVFFSLVLFILGIFDYREHFVLIGIVLSFALGLLTQSFAREHHLTKKTEIFSSIVLIPFFFISTGMKFNLSDLNSSFMLVGIILLIGIGGKIIGTISAKPLVNFSTKQLSMMGWAMNSRGALDIALAVLAFSIGLINQTLFSSLIVLALVSTLLFPFIVEFFINRNPNIMD